MTTVLLLQTTRTRDVADDAVLEVLARELAPASVLAATTDPERTSRMTDLPAVPANRAALLRTLTTVDALLLVGGRPLHAGAGAAAAAEAFTLPVLYALTAAFRVAGKRVALLGVGADELTGRDALLARHVVSGSALTVLDSPASAGHLTAAGLPAPLRVGADLAWLALQAPPRDRQPAEAGGDVWTSVDASAVAAMGGLDAAARTLAEVVAAVSARAAGSGRLAVQAWHPGPSAGADLDAASALVSLLTDSYGLPAAVTPPAASLAEQHDLLGRAGFAVASQPHAVMTAAAAGVPLLACPADAIAAGGAARLDVPVLPAGPAIARGQLPRLVDEAVAGTGAVLAAVRQHVAGAGEALDLLRLLLSEGEGPIGSPSGTDPTLAPRPTGVMR
ncbi:hypothetical protein [Nocardioides ferulae]|uniref:hypothetical protein n=1 Tax=Nocardioides ferulae TaxID=2340821 RepID=UPI000EAE4E39|nr:hypothetical protein [Nocardioides ferulae]